jgi:hypothetical protein
MQESRTPVVAFKFLCEKTGRFASRECWQPPLRRRSIAGNSGGYRFAACSDLRRNAPEFEIMKRSFAGALLG